MCIGEKEMKKRKFIAEILMLVLLSTSNIVMAAESAQSADVSVETAVEEKKASPFGCDFQSAKIYMDLENSPNPYESEEALLVYTWRDILGTNSIVDTETVLTTDEGFPLPLKGVLRTSFTGKVYDTGIIAIPAGLSEEDINNYVIDFTHCQISIYLARNFEAVEAELNAYLGEGRKTDLMMKFYRDPSGKIIQYDKYSFSKPGVYEFYYIIHTDLIEKPYGHPQPGLVRIFKKLIVVS